MIGAALSGAAPLETQTGRCPRALAPYDMANSVTPHGSDLRRGLQRHHIHDAVRPTQAHHLVVADRWHPRNSWRSRTGWGPMPWRSHPAAGHTRNPYPRRPGAGDVRQPDGPTVCGGRLTCRNVLPSPATPSAGPGRPGLPALTPLPAGAARHGSYLFKFFRNVPRRLAIRVGPWPPRTPSRPLILGSFLAARERVS